MNIQLFKTDNFNSYSLWIMRVCECLLVFVFAFGMEELYPGGVVWYKVLFVVTMVVLIFLLPVTDIKLDKGKFYWIRRSILPAFSRVKSYDVSEVQSITFVKERHHRLDMLKILFSPSYYTAQISFVDRKVLRLTMHKRDIDALLAVVKFQKSKKNKEI